MQEADWRTQLRKLATGAVLFDEPMARHTSMGVGGPADAVAFPESVSEMGSLIDFLRTAGIPFLFVGNGTNLIVRDGGFRGVILSTRHLKSVRVEPRGEDGAAIHAEAGASLSELVALSVSESLTGLEWCAGIPGSIGGGIRMNAGAYGSELKDVIETVGLVHGEGNVKACPRAALAFAYRDLELPEGACIVSGVFALRRGERQAVEGRVRDIVRARAGKHPLEHRSAGSVFKNPKGTPAGRLVDEAGLKALRLGGAQVSEKHGNFIVNLGGATAADVIGLIGLVRERVQERTGVRLEPEVKIVGEES